VAGAAVPRFAKPAASERDLHRRIAGINDLVRDRAIVGQTMATHSNTNLTRSTCPELSTLVFQNCELFKAAGTRNGGFRHC
jgi:hypothetical protein